MRSRLVGLYCCSLPIPMLADFDQAKWGGELSSRPLPREADNTFHSSYITTPDDDILILPGQTAQWRICGHHHVWYTVL